MVAVGLRVQGQDRLRTDLLFSLAGARSENLTRLAKNLGVLALREEADYFARNQGPDGNAWKRHAPATVARSGSHQLLRMSGRLRLSVTPGRVAGGAATPETRGQASGFESLSANAIRRADATGFAIGTSVPYGPAHQYGLEQRSGIMRSFFREEHRRRTPSGKTVTVKGHQVRSHPIRLPAVPARPFLGFSQRYIARALEYMGRWLVRG